MRQQENSIDEEGRILLNTIGELDNQQLHGLEELALINKARINVMNAEITELAKNLGNKHYKVKEYEARITASNALLEGLEKEINRAKIITKVEGSHNWTIHGLVLEDDQPVKDVVVSLFDKEGNRIVEIEHDCTNESGYFALKLAYSKDDRSDKFKDKDLYLTLSDKKQKILCRKKDPFQAFKGIIDYVEMNIKDGGCADPPDNLEDKTEG